MLQIPDNMRQQLTKLVPPAMISEIACFVLYDHHPRDKRNIDIIICTSRGEVKEFRQRDVVCSALIDRCKKPTSIRILRNVKCQLFYLIEFDEDIIIFSRKESLQVHKRLNNVDSCDFDDPNCKGEACLRIVLKDDAVPLIFDDDFESLSDRAAMLSQDNPEDSLPIMTELERKLIETKYSLKCNERSYEDLVKLRQLTAFSSYQKCNASMDGDIYKTDTTRVWVPDTIRIKVRKPWVKVCNRKIVIVLVVINESTQILEDVHILLHGVANASIVYATKLFTQTPDPPYWSEKLSQNICYASNTAVVVVIDMKELKFNAASRIEFNGVISYKNQSTESILPFDDVFISPSDAMEEQFDALCKSLCNDIEQRKTLLAALSTTEKIELCLRHVKQENEAEIDMLDLFCKHIQMERVKSGSNVVIHRISPYHILHGVVAVFEQNAGNRKDRVIVTVHTRSPSQILALMHYIYDCIPYKIIVTTSSQKITALTDQLSNYSEESSNNSESLRNYTGYGTSIMNQTTTLLKYLDSCMVKMNDSNNPDIIKKIGSQIDLFAAEVDGFEEFRRNILIEARRGIETLTANTSNNSGPDQRMLID